MASRYTKDRNETLRKVRKIELSSKNLSLRLFFIGLFIFLAIASIGYGLIKMTKMDPGVYTVEIGSGYDANDGKNFSLNCYIYNRDYYNDVTDIYSTAQVEAYRIYSVDYVYEGNINYINKHPNEVIKINERLYNDLKSFDSRLLFLGPIYQIYNGILYCADDNELAYFDKEKDANLSAVYSQLADFISNENNIYLEFKNDNQIVLHISNDYLEYLKKEELTNYIDLYWQTNAFVTDYIYDYLLEHNINDFVISSNDGFARSNVKSSSVTAFYDELNDNPIVAGYLFYDSCLSFVNIRNMIISEADQYNYYLTKQGKLYSRYLNMDGDNLQKYKSLLCLSDGSCKDTLGKTCQMYFEDNISINYIYCEDGIIHTNTTLKIDDINVNYIIVKDN